MVPAPTVPTARPLAADPDRLFPADPSLRPLARQLYERVADLPIISPHGHVPASWLAEDTPFTDPTSLLITPDHYVTRLLHAHGVGLDALGVGQGPLSEPDARAAFRILCGHWSVYRGTPVRYWLQAQLTGIFGVDVRPSAETADAIYDTVAAALATPAFRPRALFERFRIAVLATTDDPCDDLSAHRALADDPTWTGRVIPTFRPDRYLEVGARGWRTDADLLAETAGTEVGDYAGFVAALEARRAHFRAHGAVSADHSHADVRTDRLSPAEAERLYRLARSGDLTPDEAVALRRHLLWEMGRMSSEDGLVMTLHPAVARNHHRPTFERFGADVGADVPVTAEYVRALAPLLSDFGTHENFRMVLFTIDETTFSREIAPLAGFYPSVFAGAPWWFLDAPEAIRRYRAAVTETAGFGKTSGFIDDTRAYCSIPARHDMARRLDAGYVASLVADGRLEEDEAVEVVEELVTVNPRRAFRL
ncbi:glucuronate isomerase [Friedmanniella endophytica]|uniref:Uronate isomerase n=1 Tax=Microlunatus kandeliicorticis TaxID=1759536 RepID=A0A7W3P6C3_9ACTN|nr:glucuronate isomerase [Microlunatus kandeliicorticis]MBA8794818.1 glucuronate isomerase [Microlunatus kandeliicorticis]